MAIEIWLAFAAASAVLLVIPGPTVMMVVGHALAHGRAAALATVAGVMLGDLTVSTLSVVGLGAVVAASAALFGALKWIGGAYLVYLGVRLWRRPAGGQAPPGAVRRSRRRLFAQAYAVTALNPKGIAFFVAFVPQFVDAVRPLPPQFAVLVATFVALAGVNAAAYALIAGRAGEAIRKPALQRLVGRIGGGCLIGAGLFALAARRMT